MQLLNEILVAKMGISCNVPAESTFLPHERNYVSCTSAKELEAVMDEDNPRKTGATDKALSLLESVKQKRKGRNKPCLPLAAALAGRVPHKVSVLCRVLSVFCVCVCVCCVCLCGCICACVWLFFAY